MIERQFRNTIERYGMIRGGERILVAVSGGPDSTALLSLLCRIAPEMRLDLHVAHLDHGWRERASERDAEFVRRMAIRLGLPVTVGRVTPQATGRDRQSSREARARMLRTNFLLETARQIGATRVALGHTRDDQAESFLLRLLRGSGSRGLAGTYPIVDGVIIRPLIEARRRDVLAYLRDNTIRYRIDATNRDLTLTRNRVRRRLLPLLEREFNPATVEALAHAADLLRDEDTYLSGISEAEYRALVAPRGPGVSLPSQALLRLPVAIRRRVMRLAMAEVRGDLLRITQQHVERSLALLDDPPGLRAVTLPDGDLVRREGEILVVLPAPGSGGGRRAGGDAAPPREALCPVPGEVGLAGFGLRLRATVVPREDLPDSLRPAARAAAGGGRALLDADLLPGPLLIRPRRPGDRFVPLGGPGTRKVKSFLIDRKVPVDERGRIPLVLSGDRIAWVVGHEIDDRFKVTGATRRVLILERQRSGDKESR
jgi:tRNA(Ile)-lysidine synthase